MTLDITPSTENSTDTTPRYRNASVVAWIKRWRWFVLAVFLPTAISAFYYGLVASDVYVSESQFVIKSPSQKASSMSTLAGLIQTTGLSAGREQANEVISYLHSRDALRDLMKRADVRAIFMNDDADRLSRYPRLFRDDSFEELYKYYKSMVDVRIDTETGVAVLTVKAFNPRQAQVLNDNLLRLSEALVNRLNGRANVKTIDEAQERVNVAELRVRNARSALSQFRNSAELLDPTRQGAGILDVSNTLVAREAALRARLAQLQSATPNHPSIPALRQSVAALAQQVAAQTGRAVGTPTGLASKLSTYENLAIEQEFATQMLTAANSSLEQARAEALRQQYYLERVVEANAPDAALLPARLKAVLTVIFASLCLYLIGWMLVVGILEHAPED